MSDLAKYIERVAVLISEKIGLDADIAEVLDEAKENDFDPATIRRIATIKAKNQEREVAKKRAKEDEYAAAVGMQLEMPLVAASKGPDIDIPPILDRRGEQQA